MLSNLYDPVVILFWLISSLLGWYIVSYASYRLNGGTELIWTAPLRCFAGDALCHLPGGKVNRFNPVEIMMGYAGSEVAGQPVEKVLIGPEGLMPALLAAQQGNPTYNLGNVHLYRRNGEAFLALVRIFPVMQADKIEQIIIFITDLSEQEQTRGGDQLAKHRVSPPD